MNNSTLDDQIDDIVLAPAEWYADDYYKAKGLLKDLIEQVVTQIIGEDEEYPWKQTGTTIVTHIKEPTRNALRQAQRAALKELLK